MSLASPCCLFVNNSFFFSDVMPQLTIICTALQSEDISLEGVLATYQVTRATLLDFKAGIKKMPFLRRFVAAVSIGTVPQGRSDPLWGG